MAKIAAAFRLDLVKGQLRATILKSAEIVHLILLCYLGDAIGCAASADSKIVAFNRLLMKQRNGIKICFLKRPGF